jgi:ribose transport system substrate-binding protein
VISNRCRRRLPAALALLGAFAALAAGAYAAAPGYTGPEAKLPTTYGNVPANAKSLSPKVTFQVVANNETGFFQAKAAKAVAKSLGARMQVLYDNVSVDRQVTNFEQSLAQGVKAIIFYPLDPHALRSQLAQAKQSHVAVFALDAQPDVTQKLPADYTSEIIFNRDESAFLQVREFARLKPHGKIVVSSFGQPVPALEYYIKRVRFWAGKFGLTVLGRADNPTDDASGGERAMTGLLGRYPQLDGIIAYNDPTALGAVAAARSQGKTIIAIGLNGASDGITGVRSGRLAATVQIDAPRMMAEFVKGALIYAANPNAKLPPIVRVPPHLVTKANVDKLPTWDEEVKALLSGKG